MAGLSKRMRQIGASWTFGAVAAIATIVLATILHITADCAGISVANLPLQQAWTAAQASSIVAGWHGCQSEAINQVLLDYLFIPAYVGLLVFFGLRSRRTAERRGIPVLACVASLSARGALVAGLFDCLENIGLIAMIAWEEPPPIVPFLTSLFSSVKFLLIAISLLVTLITLAVVFIHWLVWREARA
jgi:hypothetical protein